MTLWVGSWGFKQPVTAYLGLGALKAFESEIAHWKSTSWYIMKAGEVDLHVIWLPRQCRPQGLLRQKEEESLRVAKKKNRFFQSMSFLPVGGSLGSCVRFQIERVSNGICLSFGRISFSMGVFLTICGAASGIFLTLFVAEYTSTVYMDILYPTQPSVHGHWMCFHVLLLWIVLHKHSRVFHFLKRTSSGYMPKSGIAGSFSHNMFMFRMT